LRDETGFGSLSKMAMLLQRNQILQLFERWKICAHKSVPLINRRRIIVFVNIYIHNYRQTASFAGKIHPNVLAYELSTGPAKASRVMYVYF
jgi:hypothetical protein